MSDVTFDDLVVGQTLTGGSRTITDAEIAFLPALMGASSPLFHDEVTARTSRMGRRILYGPALLGISIALTEHLFKSTARGLVGLTDVSFLAPVGSGDTITARLTVAETHTRHDRAGGKAVVNDEVVNQEGVLVLRFTRSLLLAGRDDG
jgi:oxepin-CoA hydrolase/3-oxo-5,6-dehydrosuberyl-CoA semialdehyde dehydrogenase